MEEQEQDKAQKLGEKLAQKPPLAFWAAIALNVEKLRVACQVRCAHLERNGSADAETLRLVEHLKGTEEFVDGQMATWVKLHPAWPWASRVKGVGLENAPKVLALLDIDQAPHISSFWKFAGYAPGADRRIKGEKLAYNAELKTMCWRLGGSLLKARGSFYAYYLAEKEAIISRLTAQGISIIPAHLLPKDKAGKHYEPPLLRSEGHVHNMALRKMIKMFLEQLYLAWAEAVGKPPDIPYAVIQGHARVYQPEDFCDRKAKGKK